MRRFAALVAIVSMPLVAQTPPPHARMIRPSLATDGVEGAVKQATDRVAMLKKMCERDLDVLQHLRAADKSLVDPMQPENAVQKAWEEIQWVKRLQPEFSVMQGTMRAERELEGARRSPASADFGRLRSVLRTEALGPASRVVVRNAMRLQDETVAWLKVQQLISDHLRTLFEISSESLKASEQE